MRLLNNKVANQVLTLLALHPYDSLGFINILRTHPCGLRILENVVAEARTWPNESLHLQSYASAPLCDWKPLPASPKLVCAPFFSRAFCPSWCNWKMVLAIVAHGLVREGPWRLGTQSQEPPPAELGSPILDERSACCCSFRELVSNTRRWFLWLHPPDGPRVRSRALHCSASTCSQLASTTLFASLDRCQ